MLERRYPVVLADPPWSYAGQQDKWGAAAKFYDTMSDNDLMALGVGDVVEKPGVLFLWATGPRLDFAIDCLWHWGLYYRGIAFVWVKTAQDGTPLRAQGVRPSTVKPITEFVIVGSTERTGRPLPLASEAVVQTVFAPKRAHSQKPDEVQERIEAMYPGLPKIELFARAARPGWDRWGLEAPS